VLDAVVARPEDGPPAWGRRFPGVVLFIDIGGFTPLSEALGRLGHRGTEELTDLLNSFFEPAIELLQSFGGNVGAFGGDALTVVFPAGDDPTAAARRAVQSALDLRASTSRYAAITTSAGPGALHVKIGMAAGEVLTTVVGDEAHLLTVVAGRPVDHSAEAEHHARPGDLIAHESLVGQAIGVGFGASHDGFCTVEGIGVREPAAAPDPPGLLSDDVEAVLSRFAQPAIAGRIKRGAEGLIEEHRRITSVFAAFDLGDLVSEDALGRLQRYVADVAPVIHRFGGDLKEVSAGDKGSFVIAIFGAPTSHDDDSSRALACALALREVGGAPVRSGVSTGQAWCGLVGARQRTTYTVVGDVMNTAARLMQAAAWGEVLADAATRRAAPRFTCGEERALQLKGKSRPVPVATVEALIDAPAPNLDLPAYAGPLVDRVEELGWIAAALGEAAAGHGGVVVLSGHAGVGKSRLAAAAAGLGRATGHRVHGGAFEAFGMEASYLGWREVWRSLLEAPDMATADLERHLAAVVAAVSGDLVVQVPLLGDVLGRELPANDFSRGLDAELRAQLLRSLLVALLRASAAQAPVLLVLEDAHWMDAASEALLAHLSRTISTDRVLILVLDRLDAATPVVALTEGLVADVRVLPELAAEDAAQLVRSEYRSFLGREPDEATVAAVREKAGGNPLYISEVVALLGCSDEVEGPGPLRSSEFPETMGSVVLARIDQLPDELQQTLKVASVVGRRFTVSEVAGVGVGLPDPGEVREHLDSLSRLGLTPLEALDPEPTYVFRHDTIREAVYERLTSKVRRRLHQAVGDNLERLAGSTTGPIVELLAHHFEASGDRDKQRRYLQLAGDRAKATYANEAAIEYYQRVQPLLSAEEAPRMLLKLGEVLEHVGRTQEARAAYEDAIESGSSVAAAQAMAALGNLLSLAGSFGPAVDWLRRARHLAEGLGEEGVLAVALEQLSVAYLRHDDYDAALAVAEEHHALAQQTRDRVQVGRALQNIGSIEIRLGRMDAAAAHLREAHAVGQLTGDQCLVVRAANDLAYVHERRRELPAVVRWLDEASSVADRIGYRFAAALTMGNQAELRRTHGDPEGALTCARRSTEVYAEVGSPVGIVIQLSIIGLTLAHEGDDARAVRALRDAVALGRGIDRNLYLLEPLLGFAEIVAPADLPAAEAHAREALELAIEVRDDEMAGNARRLLARLSGLRPDAGPEAGVAALQQLLDKTDDESDRAATQYEMWRLDPRLDDAREAATRYYGARFSETRDVESWDRYRELTGETLGPFPRLPPVAVGAPSEPLEALLERVEALLPEVPAPVA
jgi:class 3 adenylate cyclase/tetratricopeptide (TPR) repeat protein